MCATPRVAYFPKGGPNSRPIESRSAFRTRHFLVGDFTQNVHDEQLARWFRDQTGSILQSRCMILCCKSHHNSDHKIKKGSRPS